MLRIPPQYDSAYLRGRQGRERKSDKAVIPIPLGHLQDNNYLGDL